MRRLVAASKNESDDGSNKAVTLNECESNIVQVLTEESPRKVKGEELAEKAGYSYGSNFKSTCSSLVKRGIISNDKDGKGYYLPQSQD